MHRFFAFCRSPDCRQRVLTFDLPARLALFVTLLLTCCAYRLARMLALTLRVKHWPTRLPSTTDISIADLTQPAPIIHARSIH